MLWTLMLTNAFMWFVFGNITTFYPPYRNEHHPGVTDAMIGMMLSMFEVGMLLMTPIVSIFLEKVGRKNFIIIGNIIMALTSAGFGLLVYIKDDMRFFVFSLVMRFLQGIGYTSNSTAIFSIIGSKYKDEKDKYFGLLEAFNGLGLLLGPIIGELLYSCMSFDQSFYAIGGIVAIPIIFQILWIPRSINMDDKLQREV